MNAPSLNREEKPTQRDTASASTGSAGILPANPPADTNHAGKDASAPSLSNAGAPSGGIPDKSARSHTLAPSFIPASKATSRVVTQVPSPEPHLGWHSRGYLPHWDHPGMIQGITFRLADSVPDEVIEKWKAQLGLLTGSTTGIAGILGAKRLRYSKHADKDAGAPSAGASSGGATDPRCIELHKRVTHYEDEGHGACWLRHPSIGRLVESALLHFDGARYRLLAWCVMPNHVHALIETRPAWPLSGILHSWKSYTATEANRLLARQGAFWQREYHDRYIRNAEHYEQAIHYTEDNPVRAGLVQRPVDWPFTSARLRAALPENANTGSAGILPANISPANPPADSEHAGKDAGAPSVSNASDPSEGARSAPTELPSRLRR